MSIKQIVTAQKMNFSIKDFFSKCDQILNGKLGTWNIFLCSVFFNCVYYVSNFLQGVDLICNVTGTRVNNHHFWVFYELGVRLLHPDGF